MVKVKTGTPYVFFYFNLITFIVIYMFPFQFVELLLFQDCPLGGSVAHSCMEQRKNECYQKQHVCCVSI